MEPTKRKGRPPIGSRVEVRLPDWLYDDLYREAARLGIPVAYVLRSRLIRITAVGNRQTLTPRPTL